MSGLIKNIKRLEYANFLIKKRATGNLESFAKKMNLSKQSIKNLLSDMRELGAPIRFDRTKETYYYDDVGEFSIAKFMYYGQILSRAEIEEIGKPEELCFSEKAIFVLCKDI